MINARSLPKVDKMLVNLFFQSAHQDCMVLKRNCVESLVPKKRNFIGFHHFKAIPVCARICAYVHACVCVCLCVCVVAHMQQFLGAPLTLLHFGDQRKKHCVVTTYVCLCVCLCKRVREHASKEEDNKENM